jgi:hypothetical protein
MLLSYRQPQQLDSTMKRLWFAFVLVAFTLALFLYYWILWPKQANEEYLNHLASIIVGYQSRHRSIPKSFEVAHQESGVFLPNRGDVNGLALIYHKLGDRAFMFRVYGKNGQDDYGLADDLDVYYLDGHRVGRQEIVAYMKTSDRGDLWMNLKAYFED